MINYKMLAHCPVFKGVPEKELESLLHQIHFRVKEYKKNEIVAIAGDQVKGLYILLSGVVSAEMIDYSGKIIKIEDIEAPQPLAAAFLFGKENRFPVTVTAATDVALFSVPLAQFMELLQKNRHILRNYIDNISSRSQFLSRKLQFLSFKTIKGKLAHFLLQQVETNHNTVELKTTQQQLAELFGVTRPSLARVLGEMQQQKLIAVEKKKIHILNKQGLGKLLQHG